MEEATMTQENCDAPTTSPADVDKKAFETLRKRHVNVDEPTLRRFLVARNNNLDAADIMLRDHLVWRQANLPIHRNSILDELRSGKCYVRKKDVEGHPVIWYNVRLQTPWDRDVDKTTSMVIYRVEEAIHSMSDGVEKITLIFDRTGFERKNADLALWKHCASVLQANYPERCAKIVIYPTGKFFRTMWGVIKWFLNPVTRGKVHMPAAASELTSLIPAQDLPLHLGGMDTYEFDPNHDA